MLKFKRIKKKCMIRGCKCLDSYAISKGNEFGGVVLCMECMKEIGLKAAEIDTPPEAIKQDIFGPEVIDLDSLTLAELKELAKENGLKSALPKTELVEALREHIKKNDEE